MASIESYSQGAFNWVDLKTTDAQKAMVFYEELFNWRFEEAPSEVAPYFMAYHNGSLVAALFETPAETSSASLWNIYFSVHNVDQSVAQARELGAKIIFPPFDVSDSGRMATLIDPQGAVFSLWQAYDKIGSEVKQEPNSLYWSELMSDQLEKSQAFYQQLFPNWSLKKSQPAEEGPLSIALDQQLMGFINPLADNLVGKIPTHWGVYFCVADLSESLAKVKNLGGKVLYGPLKFEEGHMATVTDALGAPFSLIETKN